jgi:hypothetical protein
MKIQQIAPGPSSFQVKIASMVAMFLGNSAAIAADYSVGIVGAGTRFDGGGTAINLYRITEKGVELVQDYILQEFDFTGQLSSPLTLAMDPAHDFVYVAYTGTSIPNIVGFKITPQGLVKKWEHRLDTGDAGLQGTTLESLQDYLVENTYPFGLWVHVLTQSGRELVVDAGSNGLNLVSGHIDPHGKLYYSCRYVTSPPVFPNGPANTVAVYDLDKSGVDFGTPPILTSTDPTFVRSICN